MTRPFLHMALVAIALVCGAGAHGDSPAVPPPSLEEGQLVVPKHLMRMYAIFVHPEYVRWLGNSDGLEDSLATFTLFVSLQPMSNFERWCFTTLYAQSN